MEDKEVTAERYTTCNLYEAAYLDLRGHNVSLRLEKDSKRVVFESPRTALLVSDMAQFPTIHGPIKRYMEHIQKMRTKMALKRKEA